MLYAYTLRDRHRVQNTRCTLYVSSAASQPGCHSLSYSETMTSSTCISWLFFFVLPYCCLPLTSMSAVFTFAKRMALRHLRHSDARWGKRVRESGVEKQRSIWQSRALPGQIRWAGADLVMSRLTSFDEVGRHPRRWAQYWLRPRAW